MTLAPLGALVDSKPFMALFVMMLLKTSYLPALEALIPSFEAFEKVNPLTWVFPARVRASPAVLVRIGRTPPGVAGGMVTGPRTKG